MVVDIISTTTSLLQLLRAIILKSNKVAAQNQILSCLVDLSPQTTPENNQMLMMTRNETVKNTELIIKMNPISFISQKQARI